MRLSGKAYEEFRELLKTELGWELTEEEAKREADNFLSLMQIVMKPIPDKENSNQ